MDFEINSATPCGALKGAISAITLHQGVDI